MALALALYADAITGTTNISLNSSGITVMNYSMQSPEIDQSTIPGSGDSSSLGIPSWRNVTESIELLFKDTTAALVAAKIETVNQALDLARQTALGMWDGKLYLHALFDHDSEVWRSEILAAKLDVGDGPNQIWRKYVKATLIITRRYYWETFNLQDIAVSSGTTTTATTGYATVYNNDDAHATQRNWFQIAADQVEGDIPTPAKIYVKNTSGGTRVFSTIYLGNYVHCNPTAVDPIYQGSGADVSDTTADVAEQTIYAWELDAQTLTNPFHGQFGRAVVVWSDRPNPTTLLRFTIQYRFPAPTFDLALGELMLNNPNNYVIDLGALPIPPGGISTLAGDNLYLNINAKSASGIDTLGIDWVQIFPTGNGRFRTVRSFVSGITMASNDEFIDDGTEGTVYYYDSPNILPVFRPLHMPIHLWPNKVQRLRMIISGDSSFEAGEAWGVKMQARFRRLSF